ncbi:uncharacterized protein LOC124663121 [Lolium rigidum]|uniref:uncharacterized protein LOC124663121 n=1 Tax=Lolium rigidum TaxID=89674 RepID=UPI001F5DB6D3|nr:uncharacterized protein LOC124663121 [Lolium rigidum]
MEVSEIDGGELLLNASVAVEMEEPAGRGMHRQFGLSANNFGEGWDDLDSIHPHQEEAGCEDCGLDGIIIILSGFDGFGLWFGCSPAPFDMDDGGGNLVEYWTDQKMEAAAFGPFTSDCVGEWYMDGMAMMEWDDGKSYYSVYPSYSGGEACTEQLYSSPLWE